MAALEEQYTEHFRTDFVRNLRLDFFDEEEIQAILADLDALDPSVRQKTFALCHSLSHASSSLVPNTLRRIKKTSRFFSPRDLERWISHAYDLLDHQGIGPFIAFMSRIDEETLREFRAPRGLQLQEVMHVLENYLAGLSGLGLKIAQNPDAYNDTATVYLPPVVDRYATRGGNYLVYKYIASLQWAQIACGTLTPPEALLADFLGEEADEDPDIGTLFRQFTDRDFAIDIYTILEGIRLEEFLMRELPGLMREMQSTKEDFLNRRPAPGSSVKKALVEGLLRFYVFGDAGAETPETLRAVTGELGELKRADDAAHSIYLLKRLCEIAAQEDNDYVSRPFPLLGTIRPDEVSSQLRANRRAAKKKIEEVITKLLSLDDLQPRRKKARGPAEGERKTDPLKEYLLIKGRLIEIDRDLRHIIDNREGLPGGILVKGADFGGTASPLTLRELMDEEELPEGFDGGVQYDEWDYKRRGYKKKWCTVHEKNVHPGHEPFVELTRARYRGAIGLLRKKFELLRREPCIVRRQKEGDDIDLDATVEAFTDLRAGLSPRDDLFSRYDRRERDIAVLFLLDMSGSTKGWISESQKEALVLMAEALESLGDRYAISGFSGMTRNRCDYYRIKGFDETFEETVERRISGVGPKDYTRMGPPIRHSVHLLKSVEARTKLLITLSDGRPEDYDAYRGDYAIEDTRKALIEAKGQGVHCFCITIDREARSYLRHMYGEANYIIIDDVRKLPGRITEIYRRLTA